MLAAFSGAHGIAQFFTVLVIFVFVLILAILTTKFAGSYQKGRMTNMNFEVIETFGVGQNKYLQIIRVGARYVVIAVAKDSITKICELDEDEIDFSAMNQSGTGVVSKETFAKILDNLKQQIPSRKK